MAITKKYRFGPDYLVPPGATLKDVIEEAGMTQSDLADRTGMSEKTISQIINGVAPITVDTADRLELVLGVPASFWNRRELAYREAFTRQEETAKLTADIAWLKEIPVKELVERQAIEFTEEKSLMVRRALMFFGVNSVQTWRDLLESRSVAYRGGETNKKKPGYVAAWRRLGVLRAQEVETCPFDAQEFRRALALIRSSMTRPDWQSFIRDTCAQAGVAVVLVKEFKGGAISGLARWLKPDKALIQISSKYKTDDHLWFTLFHEAGHILHHGKKNVFMDTDYKDLDAEEIQANQFARDMLIPPQYSSRLLGLRSKPRVRDFAEEIGAPPGVVVGRLQHERIISQAAMKDLKKKLVWK